MLEKNSGYNLQTITDAIETMRDAMEPAPKREIYYRGITSDIRNTHRREGFFSVTKDPKKAQTYGTVFKIVVDPDVPRIEFGAEGGEILLSDGLTYRYDGDFIYVSKNNTSHPFLGNLINAKRERNRIAEKARINSILNRLFEFLSSPRNNVVGYTGTNYDETEYDQFKLLDLELKLKKIKELWSSVDKEKFKEDFFVATKITDANFKHLGLD
jgi:hypothetical protein